MLDGRAASIDRPYPLSTQVLLDVATRLSDVDDGDKSDPQSAVSLPVSRR